MDTETAILNLVLYAVWVGLPIIAGILVAVGFAKPNEDGTQSPLQEFFPVVLIASTLSILFDIFLIPSIGFRRLVYAVPWIADVLRVLIFPISLVIGRSVALAAAMIKPSQVDARFQSDLKGMSSIWASLGFVAALVLLYSRDPSSSPTSSWTSRSVKAGAEETHRPILQSPIQIGQHSNNESPIFTVDDSDTMKLSDIFARAKPTERPLIYSGVNYDQFVDLIREYADSSGIPRELLIAIVAEESNFDPNFRGADGGVGLLNVTAGMARQVGVDDYLSPPGNLKAGTMVLRSLMDVFGASKPRLWVAAYHFGTKKIQDNPALVDEDQNIKGFVDAVMRKVESSG